MKLKLISIIAVLAALCGSALAGPPADELLLFNRISLGGGLLGFTNSVTPYITGYGYQACALATGFGNTCAGYQAGSSLTTGTYNTVFGYNSIPPTATPTNGYVTSFGANNFPVITSAFEIESFGGFNFVNCTTCNSSTAVGDDVLDAAVSSIDNVGVGNWTLTGATQSYNTAVGWKAIGGANNTGQSNTALGHIALTQDNLTGGQNTAIGAQALTNNVQGYFNTALGYQAGVTENYGHGNVCIGLLSCGNIVYGTDNIFIQAGSHTFAYADGLSGAIVLSAGVTPTVLLDFNATNTAEWTITGNIVSAGTTPTIASGACGATTNGTVTGSDNAGKVTIGASATTACTISFHATLAVAPSACIITAANAAAAVQVATVATGIYVTPPTTSQFVINGAVLASTVWEFHCI